MPNNISVAILTVSLCCLLATSRAAFSWGDDGHKAIALIAEPCLTAEAKQAVDALLSSDTSNLTAHDIASESTWADRYRDQNNRQDHYQQTQHWHFTDIEIDHPDLTAACFGRAPLPDGVLASNGPAQACAVDKIKQFQIELASPLPRLMPKNVSSHCSLSFIWLVTFISRFIRQITTTEVGTT
jgi:hypothetical protein